MKGVSGAVALSIMEGTQPLLVELQALVSKANYGMPQRVTSGVDSRRLSLLLAVMEKNEHIPLGIHDVFLNVVGGLRIEEPALDLGVICAVASSFYNIPVPDETAVFGEVGLSGEIRPVYKIEERLKEIERLGFAECLLPMKSLPKKTPCAAVKLNGVATVKEVLQWIRKRGAQQSSSYK
jgi:DNA repair protein RadA/Sms